MLHAARRCFTPYPLLGCYIVLKLNFMTQTLLLTPELRRKCLSLWTIQARCVGTTTPCTWRAQTTQHTLQRLPDPSLGLILRAFLAFKRLSVQVLPTEAHIPPQSHGAVRVVANAGEAVQQWHNTQVTSPALS